MMHLIWKTIEYVGGAIAVIWAADKAVVITTGKHIPEHFLEWWCKLRDEVAEWLHSNQNLGIKRIGLEVLHGLDEIAVRTKRTADTITIKVFGQDRRQKSYEITTREVLTEEVFAQFPELKQGPVFRDVERLTLA